jgi:hypothetical protein
MQRAPNDLATAIMHLGYEDPEIFPLDDFSFDVWQELQARGYIERGPKGEPKLTPAGAKMFSKLEGGHDIPEFDDGKPYEE